MTDAPRRILEVVYLGSDDQRYSREGKTFHYYVPNSIKGTINIDDLVVIKSATSEHLALAKVRAVLLDSERAPRATRKIIAVVDISHHHREQEAIRRRAELIAALEAMERKRQERIRLDALVAANPEAGPLVDELRALEEAF